MTIGIAGWGAAAIAAAAIWAWQPWADRDSPQAAPEAAGYGTFIPVANAIGEGLDGCAPVRAADRSGMSGAEAKEQTHGNEAGTMWCTETEPGESAAITFDLGRVEPLGEMWIWNYNNGDNDAPGRNSADRGLKDVRIYLSADGDTWDEWRGKGYPFRFAQADGSERLRATNLDDGAAGPVTFGGTPARFVRLEAAEAPGEGNWAAPGSEGERVFGLAEARFYRHAREVVYGGGIDPVGAADSAGAAVDGETAAGDANGVGVGIGRPSGPENAVNRYGMSGNAGKDGRHGNDAATMWLLRADPERTDGEWLTVDLGGTYPLGEMWIWNYNADASEDGTSATVDSGLKDVAIHYSLDGANWTELKGAGYPYRFARADGSARMKATNLDGGGKPVDFGGVPARYVKLTPTGGAGQGNWGAQQNRLPLYGLGELRFFAGAGVAAEPAPEWTGLFSRYDGWTGADGIFSVPADGNDAYGTAGDGTRTVFLFSDTYAGRVNAVSGAREAGAIVNNSIAHLIGSRPDPEAIRFEWVPQSADVSLFTPRTPLSQSMPGTWYWLQDGIALDGKLHLFPLLMAKDLAQPPGFQFATRGVSHVVVPLTADGLDYAAQTQADTPLYKKLPDGSEIAFGAGITDLTEAGGAPSPDGYLYVYGYRIDPAGVKRLTVARVAPAALGDFAQWRYWDGERWSERIEDAAGLLEGVSAELSVTPMTEGRWQGKYVLIGEKDTIGGFVAYSAADTPWGPFEPLTPLYYTAELAEGQDIVTYNAKAHPHLSGEDGLLVSYNVNTTSLAANANNADIYRPRWIRVRELRP